MSKAINYGEALREGFGHLMSNYKEVFAIGQGLWAPWYVGNSMKELEKEFGKERVIDSPVSEVACTGAALGASLHGFRPIVIHPRMDFMVLAIDQIVTQAAKWSHMFGGQCSPALTIRGIINRGGEQGAQHSQALHAWFAHVPGLRVVMPATVQDARDLLISSVLSDDPVVFIDDRWLYDRTAELPPVTELDLSEQGPRVVREGTDITLVGAGYSTYLCEQAADELAEQGVSAEIIDLRVINPLRREPIAKSVLKTGRLLAVDGGWETSGLAGEIISSVSERIPPTCWKARPSRLTLPDAPAPTSKNLEENYYPLYDSVVSRTQQIMKENSSLLEQVEKSVEKGEEAFLPSDQMSDMNDAKKTN